MTERFLKWTFITLVFLHIGAGAWYAKSAHDAFYEKRFIPPDKRDFLIRPGESLSRVIQILHGKSLSPDPVVVKVILNLKGEHLVLKKGRYRLPETASTDDILKIFDDGSVLLRKVTIPEGLDKWEIAAILGETPWGDKTTFLSLLNDPTLVLDADPEAADLEGYIYPETYFFPDEAKPDEIITTAVLQFFETTKTMRKKLETRGLTLREWVTLASLIEKETALPEERFRIAGVFDKRLQKGMLLQCDPTIIYSLKLVDNYRGKIYRSDIRHDHPYNTYVYAGLPPGPIANPGFGSLEAAFTPEENPYYYFVAEVDGSHYFSKNLNEHNRAVQRLRRAGR